MERAFKPKYDDEKSKIESARRAEARAAELKPAFNMLAIDKLYVPPEIVPFGWTYYWIRVGYRNEPDYDNECASLEKGYTPVPLDRHPQLARRYNKGALAHMEGCIIKQGLMLCEIPTSIDNERRKKAAEAEFDRVTSLQTLKNNLGGDSIMPGQIFSAQVSQSMAFGAD